MALRSGSSEQAAQNQPLRALKVINSHQRPRGKSPQLSSWAFTPSHYPGHGAGEDGWAPTAELKGETLLETLPGGGGLWASCSLYWGKGGGSRSREGDGGHPHGASVPCITGHLCPKIYQMVFQTSAPLVPRAPREEDAIINPSSFKGRDLTKATQLVNGGGGTRGLCSLCLEC